MPIDLSMERVYQKNCWLCSDLKSQRGVAMTEFAIVMPLLLFFTFAVVDIARWVSAYNVVMRVAYEGARYAASVRDLSAGSAIVDPAGEDTIPSSAHGKVVTRMQTLLQEYYDEDTMKTASMIVERMDPETQNSVEVTLEMPFEAWSARLIGIGIFVPIGSINTSKAVVRAPYLFPVE